MESAFSVHSGNDDNLAAGMRRGKQGANCFGFEQLTQEWRSSGKARIKVMVTLGNLIQFNNEVTEA
jgi:hypothetical protein